MKTVIYSCGGDMTSEELMVMVDSYEDVIVDRWFPECGFVGGMDIPLTDHEIISLIPGLRRKTIVTVSETVIVMFQREVRLGRMEAADLELWCGDKRMELDHHGEMMDDDWEGGFFEEVFNLRCD